MSNEENGQPIIEANGPKYTVEFSETFNTYYNERYSEATLDLIDDFIDHYEKNGLNGWKGKFASSERVPVNDPDRGSIIRYARRHKLWHVHIGDPEFKPSKYGSYLTSDWVLHFQKFSSYKIKLLELGQHDPMNIKRVKI